MIRLPSLAMTTARLTTAPARAASKRGNADLKRTGDAMTFHGDIDPDSDKMDACFAERRKALSETRRHTVDAHQAGGGA